MKSVYKLLFLNLIIFLLLSGCTPPSAMSFFKKDKLKANAIQYTKKSEIIYKKDVEAILTVSYLNSIDKDFDNDKQNFIVGIFITKDEGTEENKYLNNENYTLSLDEQKPIYQKELSEQHKMYGHIPMYNLWAKYYLVKFDTDDKKTNLKVKLYSKEHNSSVIVSFEKE